MSVSTRLHWTTRGTIARWWLVTASLLGKRASMCVVTGSRGSCRPERASRLCARELARTRERATESVVRLRGTVHRGRPERIVQTPQEPAQRGEVAPAERLTPILFDLSDDLAGCLLCPSPAVGEADELRAAVSRIGNSLHVAKALEVVDEVDDRGLAHLGDLRELGNARATIGDVLPDRPVGRAKVGEAPLSEPLAHQLVDRQGGVAQKGAEVPSAGPLPAGTRALR
jgi:hypothetical protein